MKNAFWSTFVNIIFLVVSIICCYYTDINTKWNNIWCGFILSTLVVTIVSCLTWREERKKTMVKYFFELAEIFMCASYETSQLTNEDIEQLCEQLNTHANKLHALTDEMKISKFYYSQKRLHEEISEPLIKQTNLLSQAYNELQPRNCPDYSNGNLRIVQISYCRDFVVCVKALKNIVADSKHYQNKLKKFKIVLLDLTSKK